MNNFQAKTKKRKILHTVPVLFILSVLLIFFVVGVFSLFFKMQETTNNKENAKAKLDELEERKIETPHGNTYDLTMKTFINGEQISQGNVKDMTWTFAQIIERASYGVTLYPGDVIGSGTCGTGCFLELNGSKVYDPPRWVQTGENVVCEIDMLGSLSNILHLRQ
jgi:hypothetical protein